MEQETGSTPAAESNPLRQLREAFEAEQKSRRALETEVAELRGKAEKTGEATERAARFEAALEEVFTQELAAIPETKRAGVAALAGTGDWAARLAALRAARGLFAEPPAVPAGSVTDPASPVPAGQAGSREFVRDLTVAFRVHR
jgi:hypothetical protein